MKIKTKFYEALIAWELATILIAPIVLGIAFALVTSAAEKPEAVKPPVMADALKAKIWKSVATLRQLELSQAQLDKLKEKENETLKALLKEGEKSGFQINENLDYVATPKPEPPKAAESKPEAKK